MDCVRRSNHLDSQALSLIFVQHGIEFGFVGGDPAELLRICVENGMFTVSFLKEAVHKVWPQPPIH